MNQIAIAVAVVTAGLVASAGAEAQTAGNPAATSSSSVAAVRGNGAAPGTAGTTGGSNEPQLPHGRVSATAPSATTRAMDLRPTGSIGQVGAGTAARP